MTVEFSNAVKEFSFDIYQQCINDNSSNIILSPISIQSSLALALMGANGNTAEEMKSNLKFGILSRDDISNYYKTFMENISKNSCVQLANKIYIQENLVIKKNFKEIAAIKFDSDAENVDFSKNDETSNKMNKWIESKTNDKIKDLIKSDMLDSMTRMVLVNAIYFKGSWLYQFKEENTKKLPFWINETDSVEVDMMFQENRFKVGILRDIDAHTIEIPYRDCDIAMLIILPMERNGLKLVEEGLKNINFNEMINDLWEMEVELTLPKFKIEFEIGLKNILEQMGMKTMFSSSADFSDLIEITEPLGISDVVHKAFIEINEEGAEASAGTVPCAVKVNCAPMQIKVNRPFFYILRNIKTNEVLFTGRIIKYTKKK